MQNGNCTNTQTANANEYNNQQQHQFDFEQWKFYQSEGYCSLCINHHAVALDCMTALKIYPNQYICGMHTLMCMCLHILRQSHIAQ